MNKKHIKNTTLLLVLLSTKSLLAGNINLAKWTLQDPTSGSSKVRSTELVDKYSNSWFRQKSSSIRITAPKNGKTSGSSGVRTELIGEYGNGDNARLNKDRGETWRPKDNDKNKLTFKFKPKKALDGRVYINQIHTKNAGKRPLVMALWDEKNEKITLEIRKSNSSSSKIVRHDIHGIKKNSTYEVRTGIDVKNGNYNLFYYVKKGSATIATYRAYFGEKIPGSNETLSTSWLDDKCYFKVGAYNKTKRSGSTPGGSYSRVELYSILTEHYKY